MCSKISRYLILQFADNHIFSFLENYFVHLEVGADDVLRHEEPVVDGLVVQGVQGGEGGGQEEEEEGAGRHGLLCSGRVGEGLDFVSAQVFLCSPSEYFVPL